MEDIKFLLNRTVKTVEGIFVGIGDYAESIFTAFAGGLMQTYLYCYAIYI